ncbi:dynamin family protein [Marinobacter sp. TBZ242]|uniref:Dynamin family protein n=1 Tax=Marinobacter azerbaijanicus TaxID=3050455 RepID=A0ABT7IHQ1_9GAMM|nr:dynamin family protein [Marinobacter sp. TBZ242]MDL0433703.1 dynamin family protein [Marinobacter sp. TBZ242]
MSTLIHEETHVQLTKLASLWVWRRKPIVEAVQESLSAAEKKYELQSNALSATQERCGQLNELCRKFVATQSYQETEATRREINHNKTIEQVHNLQKRNHQLQQDYEKLTTKHGLITRLLSAIPQENNGLKQFKKLFEEEFMRFANQVTSLPNEALAVIELQGIGKELALIAGFPGIHSKNILAVSGGFSSGKSEFVNSFIQDSEFRLAVGLNPVTAIPTYVSGATNSSIQAYSKQGGSVPLTIKEFDAITHDFVRTFPFDLKTVMPYISVGTQLGENGLEHICFIDTPGYDPADTGGFTQHDRETALQYVTQSNAVLWVIGLDVNGTVPAPDLEFIHELNNISKKEIYIIANKADLKAEDDIQDILEEIESVFEYEQIDVCGISAYSSVLGQELCYRRLSLMDYLDVKNRAVEMKNQLIIQVRSVFKRYRKAIESDIEHSAKVQLGFRSLHLDILESGDEELFLRMGERFEELRRDLSAPAHQDHLLLSSELEEKMVEAIDLTFEAIGSRGSQTVPVLQPSQLQV